MVSRDRVQLYFPITHTGKGDMDSHPKAVPAQTSNTERQGWCCLITSIYDKTRVVG